MKNLPPETINRVRAVVSWFVRAAGGLTALIGAGLIVRRLVFGAATSQLDAAWSIYSGAGESHQFSLGVALVLAGAPLAVWSALIARWIIVVPFEGCPRCGYAGITPQMSRCPECGGGGFRPPEQSP